jgi:hypothetical protein
MLLATKIGAVDLDITRHLAGFHIVANRFPELVREHESANKLSRGTFAATFFLASLVAVGCASVTLDDI